MNDDYLVLPFVHQRGINVPEKEPKEDEAVKRLLILLLYKLGSSSDEIGNALGVDSSAVRRLFPNKNIRRIVKPVE